jgi:hypothetical protein
MLKTNDVALDGRLDLGALQNAKFSKFIDSYSQISDLVEETCAATLSKSLAKLNTDVTITSKQELFKMVGTPCIGTVYRGPCGNNIYVSPDFELSLLLTIGHELGHCQTPIFYSFILDELKAYLFEFKWGDVIRSNNIGSYSESELSKYIKPKLNGVSSFERSSEHHFAYLCAEQIYERNDANLARCKGDLLNIIQSRKSFRRYFRDVDYLNTNFLNYFGF